jgi:hypothetical protein
MSKWKRYVATMCGDAWNLDPHATDRVLHDIEALITHDRLCDAAVAEVLSRVGVSELAAGAAAGSIRVTIGNSGRPADNTSRA